MSALLASPSRISSERTLPVPVERATPQGPCPVECILISLLIHLYPIADDHQPMPTKTPSASLPIIGRPSEIIGR
jgi:hypothetical protein